MPKSRQLFYHHRMAITRIANTSSCYKANRDQNLSKIHGEVEQKYTCRWFNLTYFSPCSVSFVLSGEYIQYSPLINFRLIIPSNIHLQLIILSNIHLQCLCSTKNEKKTTSRRQFGIENYFYSESLTQPRNVKNKYVILRHLGDMCLFTSALRASVNKSHIPLLPQNNLYIFV
jgi:hypothetical protein